MDQDAHERSEIEDLFSPVLAQLQTLWDNPHDVEPRHVFHFTSISALESIIRNNQVWCSNVAFLNDATEIEHLRQVIDDCLLESSDFWSEYQHDGFREFFIGEIERGFSGFRRNIAPAMFIFSSSMSDSAEMWARYASGAGCRIRFDLHRLMTMLDNAEVLPLGQDQQALPIDLSGEWLSHSVIYDFDFKKRFVSDFLHRFATLLETVAGARFSTSDIHEYVEKQLHVAFMHLFRFACVSKDHVFNREHEYRIILAPTGKPIDEHPALRFRVINNVMTPFVALGLVDPKARLPIDRIDVRPINHRESAEDGLRRFLAHHDYANVEVVQSSIHSIPETDGT